MDERKNLDPLFRSADEERLNTLTHGLGFLLSVIGAWVLIRTAYQTSDFWRILSAWVFGTALVLVYLFSTLSHAVRDLVAKYHFRVLDQAFIYLLIAGTYTPFALVYLRTGYWLSLLILMWMLAWYGFVQKVFFAHRISAISIGLYVVMGWIPILAVKPLWGVVPAAALGWMLAGGLFYTGGTWFLVHDWRAHHLHAVWHLCVIAGSACQYWAILRYVIQT